MRKWFLLVPCLLVLLVLLVLVSGCHSYKPKTFRQIKIAMYDASTSLNLMSELTNNALLEGYKIRDQYFYSLIREGTIGNLIATYEEGGNVYRYVEPLTWETDNPEIADLEPLHEIGECIVHPKTIGKMVVTATTESGVKDTATVYVVPSAKRYQSIPFGVILDESKWMEVPESPGFGSITSHLSPEADIVYTSELIKFCYGAILLDKRADGRLAFDEIDTDLLQDNSPVELPYKSGWYLTFDKNGRKIAIYLITSKSDPLNFMAWHAYAYENE